MATDLKTGSAETAARRTLWQSTARGAGLICLGLALVTLALYSPVAQYGFINHDDPEYVINNPMVHQGVTAATVGWAWRTFYASNWHPVTWISHMLDCQWFGANAGGHHLTSVFFHVANTVLLFLLLRRMTGALWRSALVAALFAWHPLHVESVAWVSERKDVLSTFFFILTIWAYWRYVNADRAVETKINGSAVPADGARSGGRPLVGRPFGWYCLAILLHALGLMSKPMLVTLPFVLLLLDVWPLGRLQIKNQKSKIKNLLAEKLPFLALSALDCVATVWAQQAQAIASLQALPMLNRLGNAAVTTLLYLSKAVWPVRLGVVYPHPGVWPLLAVIVSVATLIAISAFVLWRARLRPWLPTGWFWFLGTLMPVIGLVQVGSQSMADRYTYIPLIGIFLMLAWSLPGSPPAPRALETTGQARSVEVSPFLGRGFLNAGAAASVLGALGVGLLIALVGDTWVQLAYWQNDVVLFTRAAELTSSSALVEYNLGEALMRRGDLDGAIAHYSKAIGMSPNALEARQNFQLSARVNLGGIYANLGKWPEAEEQFRACLREQPGFWEARSNLGDTLTAVGKLDEALAQYRIALRAMPANPEIWRRFGVALCRGRKSSDALTALRRAVSLHPDGPVELNDLAWFLATDPHPDLRNGAEAIRLAQRACELTNGHEPRCLGTLDAALAEAGKFDEAIVAAQQTQELATSQGLGDIAKLAADRLALYRSGQPYRQQ